MKRLIIFIVLTCTIEDQIALIRPGAKYVIHSGDYVGIEWLDKVQVKPTKIEMDQAAVACQAPFIAAQNKIVVDNTILKNSLATTDQKLNALIDILQVNNLVPNSAAVGP